MFLQNLYKFNLIIFKSAVPKVFCSACLSSLANSSFFTFNKSYIVFIYNSKFSFLDVISEYLLLLADVGSSHIL